MNITKFVAILAAAIFFISACTQAPTAPNRAAVPANTVNKTAEATPNAPSAPVAELATGKELYAMNCMICHKDTGKGGKVTIDGKSIDADDLTTEKMKKKPDDKVYINISEGAPDDGMPPFKDKMTDEEIKAVIKHVRTLQSS